jgi:cytochrome c5
VVKQAAAESSPVAEPVKTDIPVKTAETKPAEPAPPVAAAAPPAPAPAKAAPAAAPVAVAAATPPPPAATAKPIDGEQIVRGICMACHQAGMNGAPKMGNKIAWSPRIAQGQDKLYDHAIHGLRGMPPKGGNPSLSDDEVKAAVDYLVKLAGGYQ